MSYSIKYSSVTALYGDVDYDYHWPSELADESRQCIKRILFDYNKLAFELEKDNSRVGDYSNNIYFFNFEEGSVLFCLRENDGIACMHASAMGMYIKREYLSTAWLMLDKLISFVRTYDFEVDSLNGLVFEHELDYIHNEITNKLDCSYIWNYDETPYSFAVAMLNPNIDGVRYYPTEMTLDKVINGLDYFKIKSLENIFSSSHLYNKSIFCGGSNEYCIERYYDEHSRRGLADFFSRRNSDSQYSLWAMRKTSDGKNQVVNLKCLDKEKMVRFCKILDVMKSMESLVDEKTKNGGGSYGRSVYNKL